MIKSLKDLLDKFSRFTNSLVYDGGICKRLIKYKDINIGNKFQHFKNKYRKATPEEQKEMREFWDCFPAGKWDK
jgi:hypothetical protein